MGSQVGGTPERPALFFDAPDDFRDWLDRYHATRTELWMGLFKKHVSPRGLTWEDAVPEALCYGWIDSLVQRIDDDSVRQRWTARKPTSNWSSVNVALVEGLITAGRMRPAGLAAFARRRPEATGIYTYELPPEALPEPYEARLRADAAAAAFFYGRADAFCHSMVRSVVGALVAVGDGSRAAAWLDGLLRRPDRAGDVFVMAPRGLTLEEVGYPPDADLGERATVARSIRSLPGGPL